MRFVSGLLFVSLALSPASAAERPLVESFLHAGTLRDGEAALVRHLQQKSDDDEARFGLGALQFLRAVEHLGQSLYRYGSGAYFPAAREIPFLRLPVPPNPKPEKLTYELSRKIFEEMRADLTKAEATLAAIRDDKVLLRLHLGPTRFDFDGDGNADDPFDAIFARYVGGRAPPRPEDTEVAFDRGDVAWLRGYCHLLSALCDFILAHDGRELFDHTAHLFFANAETPYRLPSARDAGDSSRDILESVLDAVAFIHLIRLPVAEPQRLKSALGHFEQMLALSRESWKFILAETDDDHEWLPNPVQKNGVLGVPISQEQIVGWLEFVDEAEALLAGKRLVPFWRRGDGRGINLRRVFTEPRGFDLVLWIQGSAAVPYLEQGPLTREEVWQRLMRVFGGEFFGFALWFN